ncbi:MAG: 4-(cytidine 5'-diphospho)-2-C-methyl-D-erythritol kinase [Alphaproteobacteria bacterium]|nr:4-(cytidine 5'-diphospho)-2-C-methyl-D-erythritol kinase [Alphaproteobacteria bacterium]
MTADRHPVTVAGAAKINLYLHVTGRREDGYHLLDSLVVFADACDSVRLTLANDFQLVVEGPYAGDVPTGPGNLVLKAAQSFREAAGVDAGADIILHKNLPAASGIGGGSADAAATVNGLVQLWELNGDAIDLAHLCLSLGADVPVCQSGQAAFMSGIGEQITPAPKLPPAWLVLVNPGVGLSTPAVFEALRGETFSSPGQFEQSPATAVELADILGTRTNDLTDAAISLQPVIGDVLRALQGVDSVLLARMSGSGATCFGLFNDEDDAARAAAELGRTFPQWWVRAAALLSETATLAG